MAGTVGCFKLLKTDSGDITLLESQPLLRFTGSGPCKERQESSHPHQVYLVKSGKGADVNVLVPDLGSDRIYRLSKESSGSWVVTETISFAAYPGGGPRHVIVDGMPILISARLMLTCPMKTISYSRCSSCRVK